MAVVAFLFLWLFPRIAPLMPFNDNTVDSAFAGDRTCTPRSHRMTRILVVDNYDSFVFTIVGYLQQLGAECDVVRNDAVTPQEGAGYDGVLISPGRGRPRVRVSRWP